MKENNIFVGDSTRLLFVSENNTGRFFNSENCEEFREPARTANATVNPKPDRNRSSKRVKATHRNENAAKRLIRKI
jgi:hypothetical protein